MFLMLFMRKRKPITIFTGGLKHRQCLFEQRSKSVVLSQVVVFGGILIMCHKQITFPRVNKQLLRNCLAKLNKIRNIKQS